MGHSPGKAPPLYEKWNTLSRIILFLAWDPEGQGIDCWVN